MSKLILVLSIITFSFSLTAQIDISEARNMALGSTVTIEGIATNGNELSIIRYVQDATGGIAAYPGTGSAPDFPDNVNRGDLVEITGELKEFNGLLEIDPITAYNVISSGNDLPAPMVVAPNGMSESNEAELMQISGVTFVDGGSDFAVGNYTFSANGVSGEIYVRSNHPLIGTSIPLATVNLVGITSEFNGNYQLLLRDINDIEIADDFYYTTLPRQSNITTDGFTLEWNTNIAGTTNLEYGTTPTLGEVVSGTGATSNHSMTLEGLEPATFYYVRATSDNGTSIIESTTRLYSTQSNSSGNIRVYFNNGVDGSYSNGALPTNTTGAALEAAIINRIRGAQTSIDVCAYNINRAPIVAALSEAHDNGIIVRYIADDETANLALQNPTPDFEVLYGNNGSPLMHNKFIIVDAESVDHSWVFMGSTNLTAGNIAEDPNNSIIIQDQALARSYTLEFEEMWGGSDAIPGYFNVKFGETKLDNTPHLFNVNGVMMESYFSPSDNTTVNIINALETANSDIEFAMLTFTKNELGTAIRDAHDNNVDVRGIIESINDQGGEYQWLLDQGVNVTPDNNTSLQLHHKYAIVDATNPGSDPQVITGSHNWSNAADTRNDENTLIIHDADVANIFLQEFEARWCEATTGASCITSTEEMVIDGFEVSLSPNPASDIAVANMELKTSSDLTIVLMDMNGRILQSTILKNVQGTVKEELIVKGMAPGMYVAMFKVNDQITARQLQVVR